MEEDRSGWSCVSARDTWKCPKCSAETPVELWREAMAGCDVCGDHDARECPACGAVFDCVWGDEEIEKASKEIGFSLECGEGLEFLLAWQEGRYDDIHESWPAAPAAVYPDGASPGEQPPQEDL